MQRLAIALLLLAQAYLLFWQGDRFTPSLNAAPPVAIALDDAALAGPYPAGAPVPATRRVVLFVVDGLREDSVSLLALADPSGDRLPTARCILRADWPSYSKTGYAALGSGAPPALTGVATNIYEGPVRLETVFASARRAGMRVALLTDELDWWLELFPGVFTASSTDKEAFASGIDALFTSTATELTLVHWVEADEEAHVHGIGTGHYAASLARAGAHIRTLFDALDFETDTLLITADHGHIERGGHGGAEEGVLRVPLIALGRGIAPDEDACEGGRLTDVAPTVAALLGLPPLQHATGRPLLGALAGPHDSLSATVRATQRSLAQALGVPEGELPALVALRKGLDPLHLALATLAWLGWLGLLLAVSGVGRRAWDWRLAIVGLTFVAVFAGFYMKTEPGLSYSAIWERDPWLQRMLLYIAGGAFGRWAVSRVMVRWKTDPAGVMASWIWSAALCALPAFLAIGAYGAFDGVPLGDPAAAFGVLLGCLVGVGGTALLLLEIAVTVALRRLLGHRPPGRAEVAKGL